MRLGDNLGIYPHCRVAMFCNYANIGLNISNLSDNERGGKSARDYQRKVAKVGMHPGVTRHLSAFKLGDGLYGPLYMVDTPGE